MNTNNTPEADKAERMAYSGEYMVPTEVARKLERERDEARAELAEWTDSAKNVRKEYDDEHHCSCVAILRKLLKDAERERDEWAAMCGRYKQERDEALANEMSFHHRTHSELVEAQCKLLDAKYYDQLKS